MRCANCGHDRELHDHYRAGSDCAADGCLCPAFAHPLPARWHDRWHRLLLWIGRW